MPENDEKTVPVKCRVCAQPMHTPVVCDYCHAIGDAAELTDYFTMLGVPQRFDLDTDELSRQFVALSRHAHPDFHVSDSPEVQQLSLRVSSTLNDAYRTLKDPATRGAYLLELLGGKSSARDKSVPDGFLDTMMMMQEELADAKTGGDRGELDRLATVLATQHDGLMRRLSGLFAEHQQSLGCEAIRRGLLDEIRKQLNAVSYVRKLQSQLP